MGLPMMNEYSEKDLLRLARRWQNSKRSYLLINPLQAKHLPAHPAEALQMMNRLGRQAAAHYPQARLVIGFAETATAIGAALAACLPPDCFYLQTTREDAPPGHSWLNFQEEHSHAVEQRLCVDRLPAAIAATEQIIFVDDEISTGQTLLNIIAQLKDKLPGFADKELAAASVINRLTPDRERLWEQAGLNAEYLLRPRPQDYERLVADWPVEGAETPPVALSKTTDYTVWRTPEPYLNTRFGVRIADYQQNCQANTGYLADLLTRHIAPDKRILLLGTEEFMYPAIILGAELAKRGYHEVFCQATTRSPIAISRVADYPIFSGWQLHSFYAAERPTFVYNLAHYDAVVILSDSQQEAAARLALADLQAITQTRLFFVHGGPNV